MGNVSDHGGSWGTRVWIAQTPSQCGSESVRDAERRVCDTFRCLSRFHRRILIPGERQAWRGAPASHPRFNDLRHGEDAKFDDPNCAYNRPQGIPSFGVFRNGIRFERWYQTYGMSENESTN